MIVYLFGFALTWIHIEWTNTNSTSCGSSYSPNVSFMHCVTVQWMRKWIGWASRAPSAQFPGLSLFWASLQLILRIYGYRVSSPRRHFWWQASLRRGKSLVDQSRGRSEGREEEEGGAGCQIWLEATTATTICWLVGSAWSAKWPGAVSVYIAGKGEIRLGGGGGWRGVEVGGSPGTTTGRINVSQASLIETLFYRW